MTNTQPRRHARYYLPAPYQSLYLTKREWELMQLLGQGPYRVIAAHMNISVRTVQMYVNNMCQKLNCASGKRLMQLRDRLQLVEHFKLEDSSEGC